MNTMSRCYKLREKRNPPATLNSGDVWHDRKVVVTSIASAEGNALLTSGFIMTALSPNAATIPVRIKSIRCWAIAGTAGTYPPTFLQVNFANEEFVQSSSASAAIRDSRRCRWPGLWPPECRSRHTRQPSSDSCRLDVVVSYYNSYGN